ncbi:MAG: site-specific DNA-methyltransferase [Christensenellaceae bacterium]|jgi:adenine-specific DNA-methyltransferase|nr:site-specific DNA-methyltransferase [Christensenellaceae bacterium]
MQDSKRLNYISRIDAISASSFNQEQKCIAKNILSTCPVENIDSVYSLITQRIKTGFVFDVAPEVNHNNVALAEENTSLGINIESTKQGKTEHKLIIGENYDALKVLCSTYIDQYGKGLIDVIYIDPPYNTEKSKEDGNNYKDDVKATKFVYRDKFTRDGWLNMMNERLKLSRKLLTEKGIIFISIDDNEQAYLKVLCDEVFGEENFIASMPRKTVGSVTTKSDRELQVLHDYLLCYTKSTEMNLALKCVGKKVYPYRDDGGEFYIVPLQDNGPHGTKSARPNLWYPIYYFNGEFSLDGKLDSEMIIPNDHRNDAGCWMWSKNKFLSSKKDLFYKDGTVYIKHYFHKDEDQNRYQHNKTWLDNFLNKNGSLTMSALGLRGKFDYTKPVELLKFCIGLCKNKNATVLDFFAGSGTTGQAVMELNREDNGGRRFILVTNNENNIAIDVTLERLNRVINGKGLNGADIEWKYSIDFPYLINNSVRVFDIKNYELKLSDITKAEELLIKAEKEFKRLNESYGSRNEFDIYRELAALNPYKAV